MSALRHPMVIRLAGIGIGVVFLAAAAAKLWDPAALAQDIRHFRLIPSALTPLLAIVLPWIELLAALSLLARVRPRSGAWVALGALLVFTVAVAAAMARGLDFECGCFGTLAATRIGVRKLATNLALLAIASIAVLDPRPNPPAPRSEAL